MKKINFKNKKTLIIGGIVVLFLLAIILLIVFKDNLFLKKTQPTIEKPKVEENAKVNIVDVDSTTRPYAVMINNLNEARQVQSGLNEAYIVYEMIVEGGITRFLALYKDADTAKIGSVRSARHYYLDYALENDAIFVHWGQSDQAKSDISSLGINAINGLAYEGAYFYRENPLGLSSEHTGFTNMKLLDEAREKLKYRVDANKDLLLNYSPKSIELSSYGNVQKAEKVKLVYSNYLTDEYEYDSKSKLYKRFVNGHEHEDYVTKKQITAKNIIVYFVESGGIPGDTKGRQNLDNIGSGTGKYITEGKMIDITWKKESRSAQTKYYFDKDTELIVNDGNTFIQIMPYTGLLEV